MKNNMPTTTKSPPQINFEITKYADSDNFSTEKQTNLDIAKNNINAILTAENPPDKIIANTLTYFYDGKLPYFGIDDERWTTAVFKRCLKYKIPYTILCETLKNFDEDDQLPNPDRVLRNCRQMLDKLKSAKSNITAEIARRKNPYTADKQRSFNIKPSINKD